MAYNEDLAIRVSSVTNTWGGLVEKKMFGGVGYLLNGNMCVGVYKDYLILRLDEQKAEELLSHTFAKPFDITGRPMKGWVMVQPMDLDENQFGEMIHTARKFVETLPAK
jgi:TfoX/Sxy family transcriptional regulator of competence genes